MGEFSDSMRSVLGSAEYIQNAFDQGAERKRKNSLAALASQYYAGGQKADPQLLSQIAANGGDAGGFQKQSYGNQDRQREQLGQIAALLVKAPPAMRPQIWESQVKPGLIAIGLPADGPYSAEYDQLAEQLAAQYAGGSSSGNNVQSTYVDAQGNRVAIMRNGAHQIVGQNAPNNQIIAADGGYFGVNKGSLNAAPVIIGGAPQAPQGPQAGPKVPPMELAALLTKFGGQMTSGFRTAEHNRAVGGVPNSQHLQGTGQDWVFPSQVKAQAKAFAEAHGYEVIDEGDHLHFELPKGGGQLQPEADKPANSYSQLSADEIKRLGLPPGTVAQRDAAGKIDVISKPDPATRISQTQLRQANVAKAKLIDLQSVKNQLALVRQKFAPLQNSLSAGIGGNLVPTVEGKQFDAAVSLLQQFVRKLTRTPGEGSMSDWEGKIALLANPSRGDYEQVTADKIDQLQSLVDQLEQGYGALLQDNAPQGAVQAPAPPAKNGWSIQAAP